MPQGTCDIDLNFDGEVNCNSLWNQMKICDLCVSTIKSTWSVWGTLKTSGYQSGL